jgi:hypothetical protein
MGDADMEEWTAGPRFYRSVEHNALMAVLSVREVPRQQQIVRRPDWKAAEQRNALIFPDLVSLRLGEGHSWLIKKLKGGRRLSSSNRLTAG